MPDFGLDAAAWLGQMHWLGGHWRLLTDGAWQMLGQLAGQLHLAVQAAPVPGGTNGAAPPNAITSPVYSMLVNGQVFQQIFNAINNAALAHSQKLVPDGKLLLSALLLLMLAWKGINCMLNQAGFAEMVAELVELIIYWGIAMLFLQQYQEMTCYIVRGFDYISDKLSDAGVAGHTYACTGGLQPHNASDSRYAALFDAIKLLFLAMQNMWANAQTELNQGYWLLAFVDAIFKIFICLFYILCAVLFFVIFCASQALIYIAISLGPLFIPMVVWPFARDYFSNWIKFMLVAGFYGVLGMLVLTFSKPIISLTVQSTQSVTQPGSGGSPWLAMAGNDIALLVVGMMLCYFMWHVPIWANDILSGQAHFTPKYTGLAASMRTSATVATAGLRGLQAAGRGAGGLLSRLRGPGEDVSFMGTGKRNYNAGIGVPPLKPTEVTVNSGGISGAGKAARFKMDISTGTVKGLTTGGPYSASWGTDLHSTPRGRSAGTRPATGSRPGYGYRSVSWLQPAAGSATNGSSAGGRYATGAGGIYAPRDVDRVAMQHTDDARQGRIGASSLSDTFRGRWGDPPGDSGGGSGAGGGYLPSIPKRVLVPQQPIGQAQHNRSPLSRAIAPVGGGGPYAAPQTGATVTSRLPPGGRSAPGMNYRNARKPTSSGQGMVGGKGVSGRARVSSTSLPGISKSRVDLGTATPGRVDWVVPGRAEVHIIGRPRKTGASSAPHHNYTNRGRQNRGGGHKTSKQGPNFSGRYTGNPSHPPGSGNSGRPGNNRGKK